MTDIFDFNDIQLIPRKAIVNSRQECDISCMLGKREFKLPIVPANMKCIIDESLAIKLASGGYFYIMHRFTDDIIGFVKRMEAQRLFISISLGVNEDSIKLLDELCKHNIEYITIDIAHGHCKKMENMIKAIISKCSDVFNPFIIAGNVCTPEACKELVQWGADCVKVGIGPGHACTTRLMTGFGSAGWQLSCVRLCVESINKPVIADGGINYNCDIVKCLVMGAKFCMIGSMLAGFDESPGNVITLDDKTFYKEYYGSASSRNKKDKRFIEGKKLLVPLAGPIQTKLDEIADSLRSAVSYAGGNRLAALRTVNYINLKTNYKENI